MRRKPVNCFPSFDGPGDYAKRTSNFRSRYKVVGLGRHVCFMHAPNMDRGKCEVLPDLSRFIPIFVTFCDFIVSELCGFRVFMNELYRLVQRSWEAKAALYHVRNIPPITPEHCRQFDRRINTFLSLCRHFIIFNIFPTSR